MEPVVALGSVSRVQGGRIRVEYRRRPGRNGFVSTETVDLTVTAARKQLRE